ncbi:PilN domain-containing protein [Pantoea sp. App145]|uniref:PilN domain-containing protein n=1 Tax=Pantoea sp. App145 TaxID=3071567 RepID=UPI003A7FA602
MLTVNLLPWRVQQWQRQRQRSLMILVSAPGIALLVVLSGGWQGYHAAQQQRAEQHAISQRISALEQHIHTRQALVHQRDFLVQAQHRQQTRQLQHQAWQQFWQRLPQLMPETLWLSRIERRQGQLLLEGLASGMTAVSDFRSQLATLPLFPVIRQGNVQRQPDGHYRFTLRAQVQEVSGE